MPENSSGRPTWAEVDLDKLAFNFRSSRSFIGPEFGYMAVVKANAYGHGAVECARRLQAEGADWFGVALPEEGVELREAGITKPILSLGGFWEGQEEMILDHALTPAIFRPELAESLNAAARRRGVSVNIHVKIDSGMGRLGIRWDATAKFIEGIRKFSNLRIQALMTHFAVADDLSRKDFTDLQVERFYRCVAEFKAAGIEPEFVDLANSPGAVAHPASRMHMVRLGGIIYGLGGDVLPKGIEVPELKPVMSLRSKIAILKKVPAGEGLGYGLTFKTERPSLIALVPIGYHDGYRRNLSNKARVIINGALAPVVGRVSMDWIIVDAAEIPDPVVGNEVVLIGESSGNRVTAEELARHCRTLSYEITCGIGGRVPRQYLPKE